MSDDDRLYQTWKDALIILRYFDQRDQMNASANLVTEQRSPITENATRVVEYLADLQRASTRVRAVEEKEVIER